MLFVGARKAHRHVNHGLVAQVCEDGHRLFVRVPHDVAAVDCMNECYSGAIKLVSDEERKSDDGDGIDREKVVVIELMTAGEE